ncbi:PadR family transcriptional regulator [Calothrix sp. PCC 6303]|uniref:PadR family transcriptional regulator n=1 Tax=Calothrix sp. PCC 6303 TaxID=1170562 RepID=UPI0002A01DFA|nr:PadR family transcriptional regulator [Calothrix sp. PCC 6303]AFZ00955.1 transcriptional regulator, PadR-like family [Calothrix sp. PCC 6303]
MALAHALLAALIDSPCSGYDLAKRFNGSVGFFWSASYQQIYRELSKLEAQAWINAEIIYQENRPDKKNYQITELGKAKLQEWIAQPSEPMAFKDDLLVKIFAGYVASPAIILAEIENHRQIHQQRLEEYQDIQKKGFTNPDKLDITAKYQYLTLRNGIRYETEWLAWCCEAIALLQDIENEPNNSNL